MPIKIVKKISFILLFYFIFGISNAEENLKKLGKFKDWESFVLTYKERVKFVLLSRFLL